MLAAARPLRKVVFVNRYFFPDESATSRIVSDLAFRLARRGVAVAAVTSRQLYDNANAGLSAVEVIDGVTIHRVATATWGRAQLVGRALDYASFHAAAGAKLLSILRPGDVVVAKTDPPLISIVASYAAALRGATLVNWLQDVFPEVALAIAPNMMPRWIGRLLMGARDRSLRKAAVNIVLGNRMREHLAGRGIPAGTVRIVPNWTDAARVVPLATSQSVTRKKHGLTARFVIGYSGNLGRAHEFDTLIGAARLLRADPRFAFLITGGGAKAESLRKAVEADGLRSFHFQPLQPRELLADSLAAADVHLVSLLPALEGFIVPSKLYGILAAGRPAIFIGDSHGEVATVLCEHACGVTVEGGNSAGLAAELSALADDPEQVAAMSEKARALAVAHYTSERAVSDWLSILESVAPGWIGAAAAADLAHRAAQDARSLRTQRTAR